MHLVHDVIGFKTTGMVRKVVDLIIDAAHRHAPQQPEPKSAKPACNHPWRRSPIGKARFE